ncbi:MAG: hypothetical protein RR605_01860 [Acinetobacter sp.]
MDINLENMNAVVETGRDTLFSVDDLALKVAKLITSGEYLKEHQTTQKNKDALLKALIPLDDLQKSFWSSMQKMNDQSKALEDSTKKTTGKARDAAQKLNDALIRIEKTVNIPALEKRVELLERAADAMERLNALQQTGKLDKILEAIK